MYQKTEYNLAASYLVIHWKLLKFSVLNIIWYEQAKVQRKI